MPGHAQHLGTLPDGRQLVRLRCETELFQEEGGAEWIHIMPFGPFVLARDGRSFVVTDAARVAMESEPPLLVDWEHNSERWNGSTRAAGWIEELAVEATGSGRFKAPGVWGRVQWTPEGEKDVRDKAYRFLSPVVLLDPETRDALEIASVALTNCPALQMEGLQSYRERLSARFGQLHEGDAMKPETVKLLFSLLGIAESASDEAAITAARALKESRERGAADREMCASLTTQLGASNQRVKELEEELAAEKASREAAAFAAEVKDCLDRAAAEGRITPASRAGFESLCKTRATFASFKESVLPNLPVIGAPAPRSNPGPTPESTNAVGDKSRAALRAKYGEELIKQAEALPKYGRSDDGEED